VSSAGSGQQHAVWDSLKPRQSGRDQHDRQRAVGEEPDESRGEEQPRIHASP